MDLVVESTDHIGYPKLASAKAGETPALDEETGCSSPGHAF
jgi:hypothetical protein